MNYIWTFNNNQKNLFVTEKYINGSIYEGYFINGEKYGQGKYTFPNGEYNDEKFGNDLYEGNGVYKWPAEGRKYQGQFHIGNMEGNEIRRNSDSSVYKGKYVGDVKQGEGCYNWNNGQKLVYNWLNNKMHGNWMLITDGNKYEIIYRFGKIISSKNVKWL